jgi:AcrR family transcriptional regulator
MARKSENPARSGQSKGTRPRAGVPHGQSKSAKGDPPPKRPGARNVQRAATRDAILSAALDEFSERGFAAARLDDVARRAGVAKGTIYVHFRDKESLFEELIRASLGPVAAALAQAPMQDIPVRLFAQRLLEVFVREVLGTRRKDVLRLVLTEGQRFPQLAHIHYREIVNRALPAVRAVFKRAYERGELKSDALVRFPQLLVAPGLMAVIWDALFARFEPLDTAALLRAHLDLILGPEDRA